MDNPVINIDDINIGDTIKVTETTTGKVAIKRGTYVVFDDGRVAYSKAPSSQVTISVEAALEVGATYVDSDGEVFIRRDNAENPWRHLDGSALCEDYVSRPIRKLVAEPGQ